MASERVIISSKLEIYYVIGEQASELSETLLGVNPLFE